MWEDPIVAEVRRVRDQLAARFNYDVHAMFEDMRARQGAFGKRLVSRTPDEPALELFRRYDAEEAAAKPSR